MLGGCDSSTPAPAPTSTTSSSTQNPPPPSTTLPPTPSPAQNKIATTLYGEAGSTAYPDWKEAMQATAHIMINCTFIEGIHAYNTINGVIDARHKEGYVVGAKHVNAGTTTAISWDYAMELAGYIESGNYGAIPRPAGITDTHISMWTTSKWSQNYYLNEVVPGSTVAYGGSTFYQNDWGYGNPRFGNR